LKFNSPFKFNSDTASSFDNLGTASCIVHFPSLVWCILH